MTEPIFNNFNINETIIESGLVITNQQGTDQNTNTITQTTFNTTEPELYDPQITQNLIQTVEIYDNTENNKSLNEIKLYASKIECSDFHGKGSIDDYMKLFKAASKITNDSKHFELSIDTNGFEEFGKAADDLAELFTNFTLKLQNINIINDQTFLESVANALKKVYNLSEVFGRFKQTVQQTSKIDIPKSVKDTRIILENVMKEVNCSMNYINYFADKNTKPDLHNAELSPEEKNIINKAVETLNNWTILSESGVSIAMENNQDIKYVKETNNELKNKTNNLKSCTSILKSKLNQYLN